MIKAIDFYAIAHYIQYHGAELEEIDYFLNNGDCDKLVFLKDSKPYWRSRIYKEYKSHRLPNSNPETFRGVLDMLSEFNIPTLAYPGLEADDIAGLLALAKATLKNSEPVVLLTTDSDWLQLVDDTLGISWSTPASYPDMVWDEAKVIAKVLRAEGNLIHHPRDLATIKYFKGDTSDNIPGLYPYDLVSLWGDSWKNSLRAAGTNIEEVLSQIITLLGLDNKP